MSALLIVPLFCIVWFCLVSVSIQVLISYGIRYTFLRMTAVLIVNGLMTMFLFAGLVF